MKFASLIGCVVLVCVVPSLGWAQPPSDQVREIRDQMRALQEKLRVLEDSDTSSITRQRTTQLGHTPLREEEPEIVVRVYDLSDLLALVAFYPAMVASDLGPFDTPLFPSSEPSLGGAGAMGMGGMGGMGGGFFQVGADGTKPRPRARSQEPKSPPEPKAYPPFMPSKPAPGGINGGRISLDDLIDAITTIIEPTQWDQVGGQCSIVPLGNTLLISANSRMHEQITKLFDVFRQRWGTLRTVSVQAHWLWLSDPQVASLWEDKQAKPGDRPAFGLVNDAAWESLIKELRQAAEKQPAGYQAVFTCYNGQTVHAVSGAQRRVVTGMVPVVGEVGQVGYEPQVTTLQEGAAIQLTPMVTTGGKLVVLDVHSRVVLLHDKPGRVGIDLEAPAAGKFVVRDLAAAIDRPQVSIQHLETTLRVPVDRRMLVGGMTFEAQPKAGEPALYLFIKPKVQELRDDQTAKPAANPAPAAKPAVPANVPAKK